MVLNGLNVFEDEHMEGENGEDESLAYVMVTCDPNQNREEKSKLRESWYRKLHDDCMKTELSLHIF